METRPKVRSRRSNTNVPKLPSSQQNLDAPDAKKGHRHHHSHHLPLRHAKDASSSSRLQASGFNFLDASRHFGRSEDHFGRSGDYTPASTANASRAASLVGVESSREDRLCAPKPVRSEDRSREKQRIKARNYELRSSLQVLTDHSMKTTRDLDDEYYSCLEKLSVLQSTISTLQELSTLTRQLHESFQGDAEDLKNDMQEHIDDFGRFQTQNEKIVALEKRVEDSKHKADGLSSRLEGAQSRLQTLEEREGIWQATVSRRIRAMWVVVGFVAALVVAISVYQSYQHPHHHPDHSQAFTRTIQSTVISPAVEPSAVKEVLEDIWGNLTTASSSSSEQLKPTPEVYLDEDPRLRIFEEL